MEKWKTHPYSRKVEVLSTATLPHPPPGKEKKKTYFVERPMKAYLPLLCPNSQGQYSLMLERPAHIEGRAHKCERLSLEYELITSILKVFGIIS